MRRGFTLIETLLYIAIFGIVLVAGISAAYNLIESTTRFNNKILVESEANFVLRKLSLALENVTLVTRPVSPGSTDDELEILRTINVAPGTELLYFTLPDTTLLLNRDANGDLPLTTSRVEVSNLLVTRFVDPSDGIKVEFKINDRPYSISKYFRN